MKITKKEEADIRIPADKVILPVDIINMETLVRFVNGSTSSNTKYALNNMETIKKLKKRPPPQRIWT